MIPFNKVSGIQTLQGSLSLKASLRPLIKKAVLSVDVLLELREEFKLVQENNLFKEICSIMELSRLDMRSQMNYTLLLFSTGRVIKNYYSHYRVLKLILEGLCTCNNILTSL